MTTIEALLYASLRRGLEALVHAWHTGTPTPLHLLPDDRNLLAYVRRLAAHWGRRYPFVDPDDLLQELLTHKHLQDQMRSLDKILNKMHVKGWPDQAIPHLLRHEIMRHWKRLTEKRIMTPQMIAKSQRSLITRGDPPSDEHRIAASQAGSQLAGELLDSLVTHLLQHEPPCPLTSKDVLRRWAHAWRYGTNRSEDKPQWIGEFLRNACGVTDANALPIATNSSDLTFGLERPTETLWIFESLHAARTAVEKLGFHIINAIVLRVEQLLHDVRRQDVAFSEEWEPCLTADLMDALLRTIDTFNRE